MRAPNQADLFGHGQRRITLTVAQRQKLVADVIPLCRKFARDRLSMIEAFAGGRVSIEDLEGECYLAAVHAAEKFDPARGLAFSTACVSFLKTHIFAYLSNLWIDPPAGQYDDSRDNGGHEEGDAEPNTVPANEDEAILLANLEGDAREVVRLMVFEELSPDRVAVQMGKAVKDVRLIARNAAKHLARVKYRQAGPTLFPPTVESNDDL